MNTSSRRQAIISAPIGPTLFSLTVPMLIALVAIMGLGLVDSYFISFLGTTELAAIGFAMPITFLVTSIALGFGMAISSLTSKLIGAERMGLAARLITDGFYLTFVTSIIVSLVLALSIDLLFRALGADEQTLPAIMDYMQTWSIGVVFMMITQVCSSTFRALGDTTTSAMIGIIMTLCNVILDPILIFGVGPIPAFGMQGAAIATVISVLVSMVIGLYYIAVKESLLIAQLPPFTHFKDNARQLLEIAIPAILANVIVPLTGVLLTVVVAKFGTDAVAGFGVGVRIEAVSLIVIYAMSSTIPMFIGQNLGAQKTDRINQVLSLSFKFVLGFQLAVYATLVLSSGTIAAVFSDQQSVQETIRNFLFIVPISYGLSGIVVLINVSMNVLGKPKTALYINLIKLVGLCFPLALLGAHLFELKGLFASMALANALTFLIAAWLLKRVLRELKISD